MRFPLLSKSVALGAVVAGLLIALGSVRGVVEERQERRDEAEQNVADSLAASQVLMGPVLVRRCTETWPVEQREGTVLKVLTERRDVRLVQAPQTLRIDSGARMAPRYRGLFKVNGYEMTGKIDAQWADLSSLKAVPEHPGGQMACDAPVVSMVLGDARGIRTVRVSAQGQPLAVSPGSANPAQRKGFHAQVPEAMWSAPGPLRVSLALELAGTQSLAFAPVADSTEVTLKSEWPHPSFGGRFLPAEREVGSQGFQAAWRMTSLATTAQQELIKGAPLCPVGVAAPSRDDDVPAAGQPSTGCIETFNVSFMDPVNPYVLSDRASKYGVLFIALTFLGVILVEVLNRLRVHPIQYLLVGSALIVFFLLLVSLSEHLPFAVAYTAASSACTGLLMFYGSHVLGGWRRGLVFGAALALLYGTLYLLLQMEQTSLVLGSVMLFTVLAAIMVVTRRLDWYALIEGVRGAADAGRPVSTTAQP